MFERNKPLTDEELDSMLPGEKEGYKVGHCGTTHSHPRSHAHADARSFSWSHHRLVCDCDALMHNVLLPGEKEGYQVGNEQPSHSDHVAVVSTRIMITRNSNISSHLLCNHIG